MGGSDLSDPWCCQRGWWEVYCLCTHSKVLDRISPLLHGGIVRTGETAAFRLESRDDNCQGGHRAAVGEPRQHCRLSICRSFGWVWQILNLRRAGLSRRACFTEKKWQSMQDAKIRAKKKTIDSPRQLLAVWTNYFITRRQSKIHLLKLDTPWPWPHLSQNSRDLKSEDLEKQK